MDQFKIILKQVTARKETNMIINENNKNTILKGMVKRGFNQNPNELKEKLQANNRMLNNFNTSPKINTTNNKANVSNGNLRKIISQLNNLK